ncbi:glycerate kinase [Chloracidobacterium aggregatum]|uniref:Glycerate kinase n=1 Tax=Chloracidobacterium sp. N TaxID=2821540 RepID=A0ABX8B0F9_9BACT|nr:glycerate kinase [Chloracidobacterium aggregatum]QUV94097.1 glycerate kinase [Chloracidobacterium sp. N]
MILIAPNGFKGTLSSVQAARAIALGLHRAHPTLDSTSFPMSDGGRGFLDAIRRLSPHLRKHQTNVHPPVGRRIPVTFLLGEDGTAYAEMALASGLDLVPETARRPAHLSSRGTSELLRSIMARPQVHTIVLGLGDTATMDGGAGVLQALGVRLLDRDGNPVPPGNAGLGQVERIEGPEPDSPPETFRARGGRLICACDVLHPLLGPSGAVHTFAEQKGATPDELPQLEANLHHWAEVLEAVTGRRVRDLPGTGAAGGTAFALVAWLGAERVLGARWLTEHPRFQAELTRATALLTGEGQLDEQSLHGKSTGFLAALGAQRHLPVVAFAGRVRLTEAQWRAAGFTAVYELPPHAPNQAVRTLSGCVARALAGMALKPSGQTL